MSPDTPPAWYLFDYGMVISTAPHASDWSRMGRTAGVDLEPTTSPYWTNRLRFDAGELEPFEYWSQAVGRPVDDDLLDELERLDAVHWSHLDPAALVVLDRLHESGAGLALLSNMPRGLSHRYDGASWLSYFSHAFFSGRLGMVKPDPRVFQHVLSQIGAEPQQVLFVDDNAANVAAAAGLGLRTVLHTAETDLAAELGLS